MHSLIKELALEAGGSHYPEVNSKQLVYFTELVVQECCKVLESGHHPLVDRFVAARQIKERFGIPHD